MGEERNEDMLPIPDAFGEGVQQAAHAQQAESGEHGLISSGWHMQLVNGNLFITAESPSTLQVVLNAIAASDLLDYLLQHQQDLAEHRQELLRLLQQPEQREPTEKMDPSV